ncbi:MAG: peptide chain release factor N(5)-glutamine methyltransferase [bacterium]
MDNYNKKAWEWVVKEKYGGILPEDEQLIAVDLKWLEKGEPVDYIIGYCRFLGCHIDLSKKPLIPRPETEWWVEQAINEIKNNGIRKDYSFLDIFSGSGCIGIGLLKNIDGCHVDFVEINGCLVKQIKINVALGKIKNNRYRVIKSDIFGKVEKKYDIIFANPPYIPEARLKKLPLSVKQFEPHQALFGGNDGLSLINLFLEQAKGHLKKNGLLHMEFDSQQKKSIELILKKYGYRAEFLKDQYGKWRYLTAS